MSARILCSLSSWGARRCGVMMQHLRSQESGAAEPEVRFRDVSAREGGGAYREVLLNRPRALNALNCSMARTILANLRSAAEDPNIAMVIIEGAGDKAFCAGGDIRAVTEAGKAGLPLAQDFFREEYTLNYTTSVFPKPYIAVIDGITMGGGVGLSVHGPFRVATEHSVFAMPETSIGLFPDVGGSYFLPQLRGGLGMFLALTGYRLKGRDVLHAGIATHFVARAALPHLREKMATLCPQLLTLDPQDRLECVRGLLDTLHRENEEVEPHSFSLEQHCDCIDSVFNRESVEGILEALKEEGGDWGTQQIEILAKMSPTSLKITHHQLCEGSKLGSLAESLKMEYRMSQWCMRGHDFYEGVRAVLVDRDNAPHWNPHSLKEVTDEIVRQHFAPLSPDKEWRPVL